MSENVKIKLSARTISILESFSKLHDRVNFDGNYLTVGIYEDIIVGVTIDEYFPPREFLQLEKLVSVLKLFNEPTIEFTPNKLILEENGKVYEITSVVSSGIMNKINKDLTKTVSDVIKKSILGKAEIQKASERFDSLFYTKFDITWDMFKQVKRAIQISNASISTPTDVSRLKWFYFVGNGSNISIKVEHPNPDYGSDVYSDKVADTDLTFKVVCRDKAINDIIQGDYEVSVAKNSKGEFPIIKMKEKTSDLTYFIYARKEI